MARATLLLPEARPGLIAAATVAGATSRVADPRPHVRAAGTAVRELTGTVPSRPVGPSRYRHRLCRFGSLRRRGRFAGVRSATRTLAMMTETVMYGPGTVLDNRYRLDERVGGGGELRWRHDR